MADEILPQMGSSGTDQAHPFNTRVARVSSEMAKTVNDVKCGEKGFTRCVSILFYISKLCGAVPFDLFTYQRSNAFTLSTAGTCFCIVCVIFYASYYHYLLARMYFTLPGTGAGKLVITPTRYYIVLYYIRSTLPTLRFIDEYHRHLHYVFGAVHHAGRYCVYGVPSKIICVVLRTHRASR